MAAHSINGLLGVDLDATETSTTGVTPRFALGTIVCGSDNTEYQYVRADAAITQYDAVKIDDDYECTPLTTAISGSEPTRVGIAQVAFADTDYGWVVISGSGTVNAISGGGAAADVLIYTTTTAGQVDDVATDVIVGLKLTTAESGGTAPFFATTRMRTN